MFEPDQILVDGAVEDRPEISKMQGPGVDAGALFFEIGVECLQPDDGDRFEREIRLVERLDRFEGVEAGQSAVLGAPGVGISVKIVGEALFVRRRFDLGQQRFDFGDAFPGQLSAIVQFPERVRISEEERLDVFIDRAGIWTLREDGLADLSVPMFGFDRKPSSDGGGDALVRYDKFDRI